MNPTIIDRLQWQRDGADWPNREHSQFAQAAGIRWHVQLFGSGPPALFIHGAGAATHSWRDLAPLLAPHFQVLAIDLPGHAFSEKGSPRQLSLTGVAQSLRTLLDTLGVEPQLTIGHSAGAALACGMTLAGQLKPRKLVSLNGAHLPLRGYPSWLYGPIAGLISNSRVLPQLFAGRACNRRMVERILADTGSRIDPYGFELYWRLARSPAHVSAALGLMAHWDVRPVERNLPRLTQPLLLVTGADDSTVPPEDSLRVAKLVNCARHVSMPGLGHLAHEEDPASSANLITNFWNE